MTTDRELLELAAKAAGIEYHCPFGGSEIYVRWEGPWSMRDTSDDKGALKLWNPLTDPGEALRLAVKLGMDVHTRMNEEAFACVWCPPKSRYIDEPHNGDPLAATCRAITRAAAEIGRTMK